MKGKTYKHVISTVNRSHTVVYTCYMCSELSFDNTIELLSTIKHMGGSAINV